jgi:type I restriction enzyme S subunit
MNPYYDVPSGWKWVRLGDLCSRVNYGINEEASEDGTGQIFLRISDINDNGQLNSAKRKFLDKRISADEQDFLLPGDITIARSGSIGRSFLVSESERGWAFASYLIRFRPIPNLVEPEFLSRILISSLFRGYVDRVGRCVAQPNINSKELCRFLIPLPALIEQRRIVDVLRQAEMIGDLRNNAHALVEQLAKQRFAEMFGHPAENPKDFECLQFQNFGTLDRGISKHRPRDASHLYGGAYPFIQTGNVSNAGDWITAYKATYSEAGLAQSKLWPKGTLCITIAANIAKAAILEFDACFPDSVVGFIPAEGISSEYVLYCLRFYQEFFEHRAPKSAQMNINLETLRTLRMPKPPEAMQREFAEFVREVRLLNQITTIQAEKQSELIDELRIAAFTGELTANWREARKAEVEVASDERDQILRERGAKVSIRTEVFAIPERPADFSHPARYWLLNELSEFQRFVIDAIDEWPGTLLADNDSELDRFCQQWPIEHERNMHDRVKRALEQLAALGLIAKVALANDNSDFVTGYRRLRAEEKSRLNDISRLQASLESISHEAGTAS